MGSYDARKKLFVLYIATNGCDGWSGSLAYPNESGTDGPLATIAAARDRLRAVRCAGKLNGPSEVRMLAGVYTQTEAFVLTPEDLGDASTPVLFGKYGAGSVTIAGGIALKDCDARKGSVLQWNLSASSGPLEVKQLFFGGERMHKTRYPRPEPDNPFGSGWLYVEGPQVNMHENGHGFKDRFVCRDPRLANWSNIQDIELFIFPRYNWTSQEIRLKSYNPETGEILLQEPSIYEIYPGDRFYFRNVAEELSHPGDWYWNKHTRTLYFHPPAPFPTNEKNVVISSVENLIELQGEPPVPVDYKAEQIDWRDGGGLLRDHLEALGKPVRKGYVTFQGITVEGCDATAILMRNVKECHVCGCTIRVTGGTGVVVLGGTDCRVTDSDIYETGSHGIYLSGGFYSAFMGISHASNHAAVNNYIHHVGIFNKSVAGISLYGAGIRVSNNLIHDGPRWGVLCRGSDHAIEYNHIRHVNIETSDTAAIYLVNRDWSMRGTKIRYNRIHDIPGYHCIEGEWKSPAFAFGIYLDDWTSGTEVYGNVTYRIPRGGIYIHAGQDNLVTNNMFLESRDEMAYFRRWEADKEYRHLGTHRQGFRRNTIRLNLFASSSPAAAVYGFDNLSDEEGVLDIAGNVWEKNFIWTSEDKQPIVAITNELQESLNRQISFSAWQKLGFDQQSLIVDPAFSCPEQDDFSLTGESRVLQAGFAPLPFDKMGPYSTANRASWPIEEADGAREFPLKRSNGACPQIN